MLYVNYARFLSKIQARYIRASTGYRRAGSYGDFGNFRSPVDSIHGIFFQPAFLYLQSVQAYIAPPITAVFLVGLFYKRLNSTGAIISLLSGFVLGFLRFFLELYKDSLSGFWYELATINFLHFALLLFVICTVILITVSLFTPEPDEEQIKDVIYHKTIDETHLTKRSVWLTIGLIGIIAFLWIYFS